jgi:hypothetical protein
MAKQAGNTPRLQAGFLLLIVRYAHRQSAAQLTGQALNVRQTPRR